MSMATALMLVIVQECLHAPDQPVRICTLNIIWCKFGMHTQASFQHNDLHIQAWALPILRKIKGSPAGVEELWHTLHNSPRTEALAICEATLGKSTQVTGFVADFLGYVSHKFR